MENQKGNPVVWFEIYVDDMTRATRFYESVLDVALQQMSDPADQSMEMRSFPGNMEGFGSSGTLVKMDGMKAGGSNVTVYFGCEDCSVEESRVAAAGGKVTQSKMSIGEYGFCSIVQDTEGNTIGLHSMR